MLTEVIKFLKAQSIRTSLPVSEHCANARANPITRAFSLSTVMTEKFQEEITNEDVPGDNKTWCTRNYYYRIT